MKSLGSTRHMQNPLCSTLQTSSESDKESLDDSKAKPFLQVVYVHSTYCRLNAVGTVANTFTYDTFPTLTHTRRKVSWAYLSRGIHHTPVPTLTRQHSMDSEATTNLGFCVLGQYDDDFSYTDCLSLLPYWLYSYLVLVCCCVSLMT